MSVDYESVIHPYINKLTNTCSYCDKLDDLILLEGDYNYITIAIGYFMEGYVQICPKKHRTSVAGLKDYEAIEYYRMKDILRKSVYECYGEKVIAFEHGQAGSCHWGDKFDKNMNSLCHHAHLHCVPYSLDIRDDIKKILPQEIEVNSFEEIKYMRDKVFVRDSYLYFEDRNGIGYMYPVEDESIVPRQFLRTCVAKKLGILEKADWVKYPGIEFYQKTKDKLTPFLNKYFQK